LYKIPANTLFLGKNLVYVPQCHSTNTLATELSQKAETPEGTLIITNHQMAGRGQRGSSWEAAPGENLTFSLILKPAFLQAQNQFQLNQAFSLGVLDYVKTKLTADIKVKWPNDVLVNDRKVCGILFENQISGNELRHSIVGIGLNVNQQSFQYPTAGSLRLFSQRTYSLVPELEALLQHIEFRYLMLKEGKYEKLKTEYLQNLYRMGETHRFSNHEMEFDGMISGVDEVGRLRIEVEGCERVFGAKQLTFL
jgi:BirA family transcriptional regulator, biotin operon repressor / biotin---[acetyl-CoA-carboxylase] ligase